METFIERGTVEPFANGTRIQWKNNGKKRTILKQCFCGTHLHYEVQTDGERTISVCQHNEIIDQYILLPDEK